LNFYIIVIFRTEFITILSQIYKSENVVNKSTYNNLVFISKYVFSGQLMLSDINARWLVTSFSGK